MNIKPIAANEQLKRKWLQFRLDQTPFHRIFTARLFGEPDPEGLKDRLGQLTQSLCFFKIGFREDAGLPLRDLVDNPEAPEFKFHNLSDWEETQKQIGLERVLKEEGNRAFRLDAPPLCRFALVQLRKTEYILIAVYHELIGDEFSAELLFKHLAAAHDLELNSEAVQEGWNKPDPGADLRDILHRQHLEILEEFREELSPVDLAQENTRPLMQVFRTSHFQFNVPVASRELLFASFLELTARRTGQQRFDVGFLVDQRFAFPGFENQFGPMSNVIPVRFSNPSGATPEKLTRLSALAIEKAQARAGIAFESILDGLSLEADQSRNPLLQILFGFSNSTKVLESRDFMLQPELRLRTRSEFDLEFHFQDAGDEFKCCIIYNNSLFTPENIHSLSRHFMHILSSFQAFPDRPAEGVDMLTGEEKGFLMEEGRGKFLAVPSGLLLHELVERQVARTPNKTAMIFEGQKFSFAEVNERANRLAHFLEQEGVGPDALVAIALNRTPFMIFAVLAVLKAGGGYIPLDIGHPVLRLEALLVDAGHPVLLTDEAAPDFQGFHGKRFNLSNFDFESAPGTANLTRKAGSDNIAYVVFTSGSTGRPKGTLLPHKSLVNLILNMRDVLEPESDDIWLAHTSISFDLSIPEFFLGLSCGFAISLVPSGVSADGALLLEQIKRDAVTFVQSTPATLRILLDAGWEGSPDLELMSGGDFLPLELGNRLARLALRVNHGYGPTETTVWSSSYPITRDHEEYFPLGKPFANTTQYVLDRHMRLQPPGVPGEVYIGGDCVARGYMNRPELTAEKFVPDPFSRRPGGRLYKSGDRAFVTPEGYLRFVGRMDHQIKLRGFRIEIGEVQFVLSSFPGIDTAIVVPYLFGGQKELCGYYTVKSGAPAEVEIREYLRQQLPEYMLPVFLLELDEFPLTIRNKIDRSALPTPQNVPELRPASFVEPRNETERKTAAIMADIFGMEKASIEADFFRLGGRSLTANRLAARIRTEFGTQLSLRDVFESPTPAAMARKITQYKGSAPGLRLREKDESPVLSFGQKRLWFMERLLQPGNAYNIAFYMKMSRELDVEALGRACDEIIRRNEALRTTILNEIGEPIPSISDFVGSYLEVIQADPDPAQSTEEIISRLMETEFLIPFDLAVGPLFRLKLFPLEDGDFIFLFTVHHIAFDDWSASVFFRQLRDYYGSFVQGNFPDENPINKFGYMDFAQLQSKVHGRPPTKIEREFWRNRLGDLPALNLSPNIIRPEKPNFSGQNLHFSIEGDTLKGLNAFCDERGVTLFMVLATVYQIMLSRYSGQNVFAMGSPASGRTLSETESMIGFFVNNIVLRADLRGNPSFEEVLVRVRDSALKAYEKEDVPFEKIVEALNPPPVN